MAFVVFDLQLSEVSIETKSKNVCVNAFIPINYWKIKKLILSKTIICLIPSILAIFELMMYRFITRFILFKFDAEKAHYITFFLLKIFSFLGLSKLYNSLFVPKGDVLEKNLMGLKFSNPIGLAAGMDKNAELCHSFHDIGFGFVEIGTLTPQPQQGNPKKRLFRLLDDEGIINRMGFNNEGVQKAVLRLQKKRNFIVGGNIGKNKTTPNEKALDDYLICLNALYDVVDYFVVNVSSPNTPGLRELQEKSP